MAKITETTQALNSKTGELEQRIENDIPCKIIAITEVGGVNPDLLAEELGEAAKSADISVVAFDGTKFQVTVPEDFAFDAQAVLDAHKPGEKTAAQQLEDAKSALLVDPTGATASEQIVGALGSDELRQLVYKLLLLQRGGV